MDTSGSNYRMQRATRELCSMNGKLSSDDIFDRWEILRPDLDNVMRSEQLERIWSLFGNYSFERGTLKFQGFADSSAQKDGGTISVTLKKASRPRNFRSTIHSF
jgi:hypothetical protein